MKKTILFDLDGTLTDSQEGILKSIKFALEHFGYDVPDEETLQLFLGPPLVDAFQEHCGMTFEQAEETYFKFRERYGTIGKFENKVYPNIVDLLAKCKTEQYTIAVATAKPEHYAKDILDHFELTSYFDVIVGANYEAGLLHKKEILEKVIKIIEKSVEIPCTSCGYCMEVCPKNIPIPQLFGLYNNYKINNNFSNMYHNRIIYNRGKSSDCLNCHRCEKNCPQHIAIPDNLKKIAAFEK